MGEDGGVYEGGSSSDESDGEGTKNPKPPRMQDFLRTLDLEVNVNVQKMADATCSSLTHRHAVSSTYRSFAEAHESLMLQYWCACCLRPAGKLTFMLLECLRRCACKRMVLVVCVCKWVALNYVADVSFQTKHLL